MLDKRNPGIYFLWDQIVWLKQIFWFMSGLNVLSKNMHAIFPDNRWLAIKSDSVKLYQRALSYTMSRILQYKKIHKWRYKNINFRKIWWVITQKQKLVMGHHSFAKTSDGLWLIFAFFKNVLRPLLHFIYDCSLISRKFSSRASVKLECAHDRTQYLMNGLNNFDEILHLVTSFAYLSNGECWNLKNLRAYLFTWILVQFMGAKYIHQISTDGNDSNKIFFSAICELGYAYVMQQVQVKNNSRKTV